MSGQREPVVVCEERGPHLVVVRPRPRRHTAAGICRWCHTYDCVRLACVALHADSVWAVCTPCDGTTVIDTVTGGAPPEVGAGGVGRPHPLRRCTACVDGVRQIS